jgi:hypothetical protein
MIAGSTPLLVICRRQAAYRKSIVFTKLHTAAALFNKENLGEEKDMSYLFIPISKMAGLCNLCWIVKTIHGG